jgi:hypothetical protein
MAPAAMSKAIPMALMLASLLLHKTAGLELKVRM